MPHGQNEKDYIQWNNGACGRLIGDHTYRCMWTMNASTRNGLCYFMTFTDDLSRYGYIYLMKHKSETFEKFKNFRMRSRINSGRKSSTFDPIEEVVFQSRVWQSSEVSYHNLRR